MQHVRISHCIVVEYPVLFKSTRIYNAFIGHVPVNSTLSRSSYNNRIGGLHLCNTCLITDFINTQPRVDNFCGESTTLSTLCYAHFTHAPVTEPTKKKIFECLMRIKNGFGFVKFFWNYSYKSFFREHPILQWIVFSAGRCMFGGNMDFNRREIFSHFFGFFHWKR